MPEHSEPFTAKMFIIIHPGSLYLRIGRASDLNPCTILNVIGRRRKPSGCIHKDEILPRSVQKTEDLLKELEECRLQVSHAIQSSLQSDGRRRYATPPQQIAAFNRRSSPETINDSKTEFLNPCDDTVFDTDILNLDPDGEFNIHFPMRRGEFYVHDGIGGSLTSVMADFQTIIEHALTEKLQINLKEIQQYKAVMVIPDIYNRTLLKEVMNLLIKSIGFGSAFLVQDHVAATFGAGLGYACVVDVGDQKTSISCVEDGISHSNTRVRLDYGGGDITQTFYWLLQKCGFPYKDCDPRSYRNAMLLKQLKEEFCHVDMDVCGPKEKTFKVENPCRATKKYTIQVGDEAIVAPLSLFHTELLNITGTGKKARVQNASYADHEDCFDSEYLRETGQRRGGRTDQLEAIQTDGVLANQEPNDDDIVVDNLDIERDNKPIDKEFVLPAGQIIGLDQAVLQCIERCPNEELKRKMYGCILVVGGGMRFTGIGKWLQNRVSLQIPYLYRSEHIDIVTSPKDMDPSMTTWKGAAVMSCLESAPELWISRSEWIKHGIKILREKAPFIW